MPLTNADKELIKQLIDEGKPLPSEFRFVLFEQPDDVELIF